jgi:hypothetical protein
MARLPSQSRYGFLGDPALSSQGSAEAWIQPKRESLANKRKQLQINESKKAFICFHLLFGIGTFQWVTSEKIKNSGRLSTRAVGCAEMPHQPLLTRVPLLAGHDWLGRPFAQKCSFPIIRQC